MSYKVITVGIKSKEINEIINDTKWNWRNFEKGDTVYIESFTSGYFPNLTFQGISDNNEVILSV